MHPGAVARPDCSRSCWRTRPRRGCPWARCWAPSGPSRTSRRPSARTPATGTSSASRGAPRTCWTCCGWPDRGRAALARRGAPVRVGGRARRLRGDHGSAAVRPGLPGAPRAPGWRPGGDARLLRFDQGVGTARRCLDAVLRSGTPGRGVSTARRPADAVPRPGWRHRTWRRANEPGHPRWRPRLPPGPSQADRAGRGHRGPLRQPVHRAAPPGAGHQCRARGVGSGAR